MSAATAVFNTYELLENIIAFLPPPSIRHARSVAQRWRQLSERSTRIRRARCMAAWPKPHRSEDDCIDIAFYAPKTAVFQHPLLYVDYEDNPHHPYFDNPEFTFRMHSF